MTLLRATALKKAVNYVNQYAADYTEEAINPQTGEIINPQAIG